MLTIFIVLYAIIAVGWFFVTAIGWLALRNSAFDEDDQKEARAMARYATQAPIWPLPVFHLFRQLWKDATT